MAVVLGMDCKLYRNTGSYATPTWNEVGNCTNVTLNLEKATADVTTRGNNGWRASVATLKDGTVEFEMIWDTDNDDFQAFRNAWLNNTAIEVLALDGPVATAGSEGLRMTSMVVNFSREEPLEEGVKVKVSLKPTYAENAPEWFTAS